MNHFLFTRFNLKKESWKLTKNKTEILTEDWIDERFYLFEKFCLPSVVNQINQNFHWVIFFDSETLPKYKEKIEFLIREFPKYKVLYLQYPYTDVSTILKEYIKTHSKESYKYVISSRLDNDDGIHENFIDTIQKLATKQHNLVIDVRKGIQLDITEKLPHCRTIKANFNHYISLVEETEISGTIFSKEHTAWENSEFLQVYTKSPLWIEVVHENNMLNRSNKKQPLLFYVDLGKFGLDEKRSLDYSVYALRHNSNLLTKTLLSFSKQMVLVFKNKFF